MLYSIDWHVLYADHPGNLIGDDRIGSCDMIVKTAGKYEVTLSRCHPDAGIALKGPSTIKNIEAGAIPVAQALLKVNDFDQAVNTSPKQTEVKFTTQLYDGVDKIETCLLDNDSKILCSAFYTKVELLK